MASRIKTSQGWEGSLRACLYMSVQRGLFSGCATEGNEQTLALGPWRGPYKCEVYFFNYLLICFWLHWIFVAAHRLSLVVVSGGYSLQRLLWRSTGSLGAQASVCCDTGAHEPQSTQAPVVAMHGLQLLKACGVSPGQGLKGCPLHWQADYYPLHHQQSPVLRFYFICRSAAVHYSVIHLLIHSINKSLLPVSLHFKKKKDKNLLSRLVPSDVEKPHQVINKTIKDEGRMWMQCKSPGWSLCQELSLMEGDI